MAAKPAAAPSKADDSSDAADKPTGDKASHAEITK